MAAVQKLCKNAIFLNNGRVNAIGKTSSIVAKYLQSSAIQKSIYDIPCPEHHQSLMCVATKLQIEDLDGNLQQEIPIGQAWQVRVSFKINKRAESFLIALAIFNSSDLVIRTSWSEKADLNPGCYEAVFKEDQLIFAPGLYTLSLGLSNYENSIHYVENVAELTISDVSSPRLGPTIIRVNNVGVILNPMSITISKSQI
jgi:hypothetical protein